MDIKTTLLHWWHILSFLPHNLYVAVCSPYTDDMLLYFPIFSKFIFINEKAYFLPYQWHFYCNVTL